MSEKRKVKSSKGPEDNARMLVGEKPVNTKGALGTLIA